MSLVCNELNDRSCRTYLVYDELSREAILIDPILDLVKNYLKEIDQKKLALMYVIDTHTHADHLSGGSVIKKQIGCDYIMHHSSKVSDVSWWLYEGLCCYLGDHSIRMIHTPGHTKDSVSLLLSDRVFVGDLLFLDDGGAGRLDLPGGDAGEHWDSLQRILGLPEHLVISPAHDYHNCVSSSIAVQKTRNKFLTPSTRQDYIAFAKGLRYGPVEWMKDVLRLNEECSETKMRAYVLPFTGNACENVCESGASDDEHVAAPQISAQELYSRWQGTHVPILFDVRENDELVGDLPALRDIIHIPVGVIADRVHELIAYKTKPIVVICRSGKRAMRAAGILAECGFTHVSVLNGGMLAWFEAGLSLDTR